MLKLSDSARAVLTTFAVLFMFIVIVLIAPPSDAAKPKPINSTATGQAVHVALDTAGTFLLEENDTYAFNDTLADAFFSTSVTGPVVSCTGRSSSCDATNQPSTPMAPPADPARRYDAAIANQCVFANGGVLAGLAPYTQEVMRKGLDDHGNFTFTWTYVVAPLSSEPVAALTAWDLVNSAGGAYADIAVGGFIAAESSMTSTQFPSRDGGVSPGKVSFSLDPTRIANLAMDVTGTTLGGQPVSLNEPAYTTIVTGKDFPFPDANGGLNSGNPILYGESAFSDVLLKDGTTANDDLNNLVYADITAVNLSLAPGDYAFNLTGSVKDVSTNTSGSFSVTQSVHVITRGCGSP